MPRWSHPYEIIGVRPQFRPVVEEQRGKPIGDVRPSQARRPRASRPAELGDATRGAARRDGVLDERAASPRGAGSPAPVRHMLVRRHSRTPRRRGRWPWLPASRCQRVRLARKEKQIRRRIVARQILAGPDSSKTRSGCWRSSDARSGPSPTSTNTAAGRTAGARETRQSPAAGFSQGPGARRTRDELWIGRTPLPPKPPSRRSGEGSLSRSAEDMHRVDARDAELVAHIHARGQCAVGSAMERRQVRRITGCRKPRR